MKVFNSHKLKIKLYHLHFPRQIQNHHALWLCSGDIWNKFPQCTNSTYMFACSCPAKSPKLILIFNWPGHVHQVVDPGFEPGVTICPPHEPELKHIVMASTLYGLVTSIIGHIILFVLLEEILGLQGVTSLEVTLSTQANAFKHNKHGCQAEPIQCKDGDSYKGHYICTVLIEFFKC